MSNVNEVVELMEQLLEDMEEDAELEFTLMNKFMYAYKKGELAGKTLLEVFVLCAIEKNIVEDLMKEEGLDFTIENYKGCLSNLLKCHSEVDRDENECVENVYKKMKSDVECNNIKDEKDNESKNLN